MSRKISYEPIPVVNEVLENHWKGKMLGNMTEYEWKENEDGDGGDDGSSYRDQPIIPDCHLFHEVSLKYVEKWKMKSSAEEI